MEWKHRSVRDDYFLNLNLARLPLPAVGKAPIWSVSSSCMWSFQKSSNDLFLVSQILEKELTSRQLICLVNTFFNL